MDSMVAGSQSGSMFLSGYCEEAGTEVLLGPANFLDLVDGPLGFEVHYRCHCGRGGVAYPKTRRPGRCGRGCESAMESVA